MEIKQLSIELPLCQEEIKKLKTSQNSMKMNVQYTQINGHNESNTKNKVHSTNDLHKNLEKFYASNITGKLQSCRTRSKHTQEEQTARNNETEHRNQQNRNRIQRINKKKRWFFEKMNKIDKPLSNLTKRQRENIQTNKIRS